MKKKKSKIFFTDFLKCRFHKFLKHKYNPKRNFVSTTEPKGIIGKSKKEVVFVLLKHAVSHLHYDLRLEIDSVLQSLAVPKCPVVKF